MTAGIPVALTSTPGDVTRGRAIVKDRRVGLCLLCHSGPFPDEEFQGDIAPDLAGAGKRQSVAQLRLRIVDAARMVPDTMMPPYFRSTGRQEVGKAYVDKTLLTAQQVEDVVAYLATLKTE